MCLIAKIKIYPAFFLIFILALSTSYAFANTSEYQFTAPENKTDIIYNKDIYNEIGTLKIATDSNFDDNKKVILKIQYDGKFTNSKNSEHTVAYNLVLGTQDSYEILNSGDKIEFSTASIDVQDGITIGAVIVGDVSSVSDGNYETEINFTSVALPAVGKSYMFGIYDSQPLIWRVLTVDDINKRTLLVTENCVTKMKYADASNAWTSSAIRRWLKDKDINLNGDKFVNVFSTEETNQILSVKIEDGDNSDSTSIIAEYGAESTDKIFLLSKTDAKNYFKDNDDRIAMYSDVIFWWLRSPVMGSDIKTDIVNISGGIVNDGYIVTNVRGVRPALWLDLSTTEEQSASMSISFTKTTETSNNNSQTDNTKIPQTPETNESIEIPETNDTTENYETNQELINNNLKDVSEDELKEKFENTSNIILSGDLSGSNGKEVADFIKKIENVTYIKTLDLSNVTGLTEVALPENTKIEELNIENSSTLTTLDVSSSSLKKLNTNGCSKLESLNCESCDITELNVEGCSELLELNCSYNCLTSLKIADLKNLSSLKCEHQVISGIRRVEQFNFIDFLYRTDSEIFSAYEKNKGELVKIKDLRAFNNNGEAVGANIDENTGNVSFSEAPATIKYNYETGFKNILMDVTVKTAANEKTKENESNNNNGGGGCNLGGGNLFYCFAFLVFATSLADSIRLAN